jgi:pimeloyl-ACP methyl ester carboxylesterase
MRKNHHKLLTLAALFSAAAGIIHIANRIIVASSQLKELLDMSGKYYEWRFGKIHYTKKGSGSPVLLIHDALPGSSGYEWNRIENSLALEHTVYTIDLLGCGRSDKPGITYTNFLYVQLISDFVKDVIKEKTNIIASGFSGSFALMSALNEKEYLGKIMLINPPSIGKLQKMPGEKEKFLKHLLEIPVFGTLVYHMIVSREAVSDLFLEKMYYNPFHADNDMMDAYYESAHKGGCYAKHLYASIASRYLNINIKHALSATDSSIYIVYGEEPNSSAIVDEYVRINPAIESCQIKKTMHLPHVEDPEHFLEQIGIFF